MKSLLVISLLLLGVCEGADPVYTTCYADVNSQGRSITLKENADSLDELYMDDDIESVQQTGLWLYYSNPNYNEIPGDVYYVHGIDISVNFPFKIRNRASSVRNVQTLLNNDRDMITLYDGKHFSGREFVTPNDMPSIGHMYGKTSSIIITGRNPWTVYSGKSFTGIKSCLFPSLSLNPDSDGQVINLGFYPDMTSVGLADGAIMSVQRGCFSTRAGVPSVLEEDGRHENGTWGAIA